MKSEKNQLTVIGIMVAMIAIVVVMFLIVGGEFDFFFIQFSAEGVLSGSAWLMPLILAAAQQLYVVPAYVKSYYRIFSDTPPLTQEIYVPVLNENVVLQDDTLAKATYVLWAVVAGLIVLMITPALGLLFGGPNLRTIMFYMTWFVLIAFAAITVIRGIKYLARRRDIYDLHNKYLGVRGTSAFNWVYLFLYFVPLGRSLALLADIQVMDKLTKFNDIEQMKTELVEEDEIGGRR